MERADDGKIMWRKKGGGSFMFNRKLIRPGMTFRASVDEIPVAFRDLLIPLEPIEEAIAKADPLMSVPKVKYKVKPRGKSKTWFDVVNEAGKPINDKALTKELAQGLQKDLMA